jgi:hypothetical protein
LKRPGRDLAWRLGVRFKIKATTMILDDQSAEPGTHALLIGVGDYP